MHKVFISKSFSAEFKELVSQRKSLAGKLLKLKNDLKLYGLSHKLYQSYNIVSLDEGYYRVKRIPLRVIIRVDVDGNIYLEKIFKRKGKSDYKAYQ